MGTNLAALNSQASLLQAKENRILQGTDSSKIPTDAAKIDKGSQEFEAILLGSWLQQAEQSFATVPGADDDEDSGTRDQTMSFAIQSLATSMAASGGIGLGKMIAKAMHAQAEKQSGQPAEPAKPSTTNVHTIVQEKRY